MRKPVLAILAAAVLPATTCPADPLTAADREALLEKLDDLRDGVQSQAATKFQSAITAYRSAMNSPEATIALYLKCTEKVNFTDRNRKASEFRAWKRRHDDQFSEPSHALALRHQLRWLTLTLKASMPKADQAAIGKEAFEALEDLARDAPRLGNQTGVLAQPVFTTVFARAYNISRVMDPEWPEALMPIEKIYEKVILPPLRGPEHLDALKRVWTGRIEQESILTEHLQPLDRDGRPRRPDPTAGARFETETRPELAWKMETDLFQNGDQRGAAVRMLQHLEDHVGHKSAREWASQFRDLLNPKVPSPSATAATESYDESYPD